MFGRKAYNFDHVEKFCISQGSAVTFSGVVDKCIRTNVKCFQDSGYQNLLKSHKKL